MPRMCWQRFWVHLLRDIVELEACCCSGSSSATAIFNAGEAMKAILFLDDWMVEHRDSLERVWGKPEFVKELFTDCYPGYLGYGG